MAAEEVEIQNLVKINDDEKNENVALMNIKEPQPEAIQFMQEQQYIAGRSDRGKKLSVYSIFILAIGAHYIGKYYDPNRSKYKVIASILAFTVLWLFISILIALYRSNEVYRIRVYTQQIPQTCAITIPYKVVHYRTIPCGSISEFCATRGSPFYMILLVTCTLASWLPLGLVISEESAFDDGTNHLFIAGCLGLFTIGIWELHPEDNVHVLFHFIGVFALLCYPVAYCIQSGWNVSSVALLCAIVLLLFLFIIMDVVIVHYSPLLVKESDDPKKVKRTSVIYIVGEMIFLALLILAGVAFILNLEQK